MPAHAQKNKNEEFLSSGNALNFSLFTGVIVLARLLLGRLPMQIDLCTLQIIGPIPMAKETDVTVD